VKRVSERMWLGGLAAAGVVVAHSLTYVFAAPDPHARQRLLDATGHRYFTWVTALALGALVAGLAGGTIKRIRGNRHERSAVGTFAWAAAALVLLQVFGFIGLEAAERYVAGGAPWQLFADPVVAIGCAIQVLVALVGALLLLALACGVDYIASLLTAVQPAAGRRIIAWWATSILPPTPVPVAHGRPSRGPPHYFS
jgi:hypothetical protein